MGRRCINAVTMPTGISRGENTVRAAVSAQIKKIAPVQALSGRTARCPAPVRRRTTWGITSPTNPSAPLTATMQPVRRATKPIIDQRIRVGFSPSEDAAESPKANPSSSLPENKTGTPESRKPMTAIPTEDQVDPDKEPISQLRTSR